jgi:hypothetical protein
VTKSEFDGGNFFGIAMGEVGDIPFADVRAIAIGLSEVDGFIGLAVGGGQVARAIYMSTKYTA